LANFDTGKRRRTQPDGMTKPQANQPVFQTPNPEELKKAAQEDPIPERENAREADLIDEGATDSADQLGQEISAEMAHSQATIANLSGH